MLSNSWDNTGTIYIKYLCHRWGLKVFYLAAGITFVIMLNGFKIDHQKSESNNTDYQKYAIFILY